MAYGWVDITTAIAVAYVFVIYPIKDDSAIRSIAFSMTLFSVLCKRSAITATVRQYYAPATLLDDTPLLVVI